MIPPAAAAQLEDLWFRFLNQHGYSPIVVADEVSAAERFWEGALRRITANAYERDPVARRACIAHFGALCQVCSSDFEAVFGALGRGFIHVRHLRPLSAVCAGYAVDPLRDLIPVCPNCHAMLHQSSPPLSVVELRKHFQ
jgi:5-methylcytosine-specific restriction enzyme A